MGSRLTLACFFFQRSSIVPPVLFVTSLGCMFNPLSSLLFFFPFRGGRVNRFLCFFPQPWPRKQEAIEKSFLPPFSRFFFPDLKIMPVVSVVAFLRPGFFLHFAPNSIAVFLVEVPRQWFWSDDKCLLFFMT